MRRRVAVDPEMPLARAAVDFRFALGAAGRSPKTVSWYADILAGFIAFASDALGRAPHLTDLNLELARRYATALVDGGAGRRRRRPASVATRRGYLKALKSFSAWLRAERYLRRDPLAGLLVPRAEERLFPVFSDEQLRALLTAAAGDSLRARRWTAALWLLLDGGLRASELTGLTLDRLDLERGEAKVIGKGGRERLVPLGDAAIHAVRRYLAVRGGPPRGALLLDRAGRPLSRMGLYRGVRALGRRADLRGVRCSPHTFRHTFATRFLTLGGDVLTLQRLLGHSPRSLAVTQRYVALLDEDLRAAHRRASPGDALARSLGAFSRARRPTRRRRVGRAARPRRAVA